MFSSSENSSCTSPSVETTILSWTTTATTDVNCNGGNDGTLTATATGGTGIINYNLQPTNQTNNTGLFTNLTAGTYTVTATDANGCTLTTTLVINQSPALTWTQNTATNITCNGGNDGSITTTATGGTGIINYNLQPTNQTNNTGLFTNLAANTYTILATDANGCTISTTLTITEPTLLSITNITTTNPTCVPGNDGSMTITASGGTLAYTYNIGGANQANNVFANLGAGNYTITVTDANGCTATSTQTIAPPNSPTITAVVTTDVDCNGGNNGSITVTATGGVPPYKYSVDGVNWQDSNIFTGLPRGENTIYVKDTYNCTPIQVTVTVPNLINAITPNGDNVNDVIDYSALAYKKNLIFIVYDRYGNKLHEAKKFNNFSWDGTAFGKKIPTGTYWYTISWNENNKNSTETKYSGWVLVKNKE